MRAAVLRTVGKALAAHPELGQWIAADCLRITFEEFSRKLPATAEERARRFRKARPPAPPPKRQPATVEPPRRVLEALKAPSQEEVSRLAITRAPHPEPPTLSLEAEAISCRALLLEIVRRAACDWVLYRSSSRLDQKQVAEEAFHWLFVEEPGCASWRERQAEDGLMMAFVAICEAVDLEPEMVRGHVRKMTLKQVKEGGRPPQRRHVGEEVDDSEHAVRSVSLDDMPVFDPIFASD